MAELTPLFMDISSVYSGDELGLPYRDIIGEGVVDLAGGDLAVSQHAGTPGLSVDIAAGAAWVLGDTNADAQPVYRVRNDAVVNLGISPDPSNDRIVIIVAQITDETFAGTGRQWQLQAIHGTPAGSPTEPATPDSALKLAVIDVSAGATSIVNADITDARVQATVGGGNLAGGSGGPSPIDFRNPATVSGAGNCFPTVTSLTAWEEWHWEFVKDVDGALYGIVRADGSASHVKLAMLWNATTGVSRFKVEYALASDGDSLNPGSLTAITSQDITVPGTARLRKDVTFDLGAAPAAGDVVIVKVTHEGAHANDTVAVNSELLGGWLV